MSMYLNEVFAYSDIGVKLEYHDEVLFLSIRKEKTDCTITLTLNIWQAMGVAGAILDSVRKELQPNIKDILGTAKIAVTADDKPKEAA